MNGARLSSARAHADAPVLITGGAGFIGSNLARRLLGSGERVRVLDNLSRPGAEANLSWLAGLHGSRLQAEIADVRDARALRRALKGVRQVFHFAAQVAVTTSLANPAEDFSVNVQGTLTLLEALRALPDRPLLVFASTNKVYGDLGHLELLRRQTRYVPADPAIRLRGIGERCPLSFYSPYGCSKGAADQYVIDYARVYSLPALVFRLSCVYGPRQHGTEDQGWVAHFLNRALEGRPIVLYGDGLQVRDLLFIDDLVDAFLLARWPDKPSTSAAARATRSA